MVVRTLATEAKLELSTQVSRHTFVTILRVLAAAGAPLGGAVATPALRDGAGARDRRCSGHAARLGASVQQLAGGNGE